MRLLLLGRVPGFRPGLFLQSLFHASHESGHCHAVQEPSGEKNSSPSSRVPSEPAAHPPLRAAVLNQIPELFQTFGTAPRPILLPLAVSNSQPVLRPLPAPHPVLTPQRYSE